MGNYVVSARKYRPATFDTVVGQSTLTTTLKNSIAAGKLAHAYLFCGPRGVGKTTCARIFARTINCFSPNAQGEACGQCESCVAFNDQVSYNIHELDAASNNSVEDIRSLIEQVRIQPQVGKYKVFIIDEVHMLSSAAFNAFLKTLEEPPAHAIFILATTEKHKILPTILSRCQIYDFNRMEVNDIVAHLKSLSNKEGYQYEEEALNVIARKADGGMRDALSIFDQVASYTGGNITYQKVIEDLNVLDEDYYFKMTDELLAADVPSVMLTFHDILSKGFEANHFIGGLASHFRNLLVSRDPQTLILLETSESVKQKYSEQAQKCRLPFLYKALRLCNECDINYRTSRNKRLLVEIVLIEVAQAAEEDSPGCGLGPTKKLKPIFNKIVADNLNHHVVSSPATPVVSTQPVVPEKKVPSSPVKEVAPVSETNNRKVSIPKTISIRTMPVSATAVSSLSKNEAAEFSVSTTTPVLGIQPFEEKELQYHWFRFAVALPAEQSAVAGRMKNMQPHLLENYHIEVAVDNQQVLDYMNSLREKIMHYLQIALNNKELNLTFRVTEETAERKRLYSPRERWSQLLQDYPVLSSLRDKLGLELS